MRMILNYEIIELLYEGKFSSIFRVRQAEDFRILKILNQEYPTILEISKLKHEYSVLKNLDHPGIPRIFGLEKHKNQYGIVIEDIGGKSLKQLFKNTSFATKKILEMMIQAVDILGYIHSKQVIHKDINPSNIIYNDKTGHLQIIDFGIASKVERENQQVLSPNLLEGTLFYISPEQTGRMNRAIDYRTDFYSLGVCFYELFTGKLPFTNIDMMELVHSHLAKTPVAPHIIEKKLPKAISDILVKCMNKTAEDRYISAESLKYDLNYCMNHFDDIERLNLFIPGTKDITSKFQLTSKLYGREADITKLITTFDKVNEGNVELMFVGGYSGIGKSALVHEIYKPITESKGYFISGKFDQYSRNIPYTSIIQAFKDMIKQLLTESDARIDYWRNAIINAVQPNGQILIEVIPELELIIGKQPAVPELAPTESQNRFNQVFISFIQALAKKEHPLVLFLDDLQWADLATLKLLKLLLTDQELSYIYFIGAYRNNEIGKSHPFSVLLSDLNKEGKQVNEIFLNNLQQHHIQDLVLDSFQCGLNEAIGLAEIVIKKTSGNPFFVNSFLKTLYEEKYITFDMDLGWKWDRSAILEMDITDNVVDLMVRKIKMLPTESQQALRLASCIGNIFDLQSLAVVAERPINDIINDLYKIIQEGLIIPLNNEYKFILDETHEHDVFEEQNVNFSFKFLHDRVQQAAYTLISEEEKPKIHYQVGWLIYENIEIDEIEEKVFEFVNHMNLGVSLVNEEELLKLINFNLIAGKRAKQSMAYESAVEYLEQGYAILATDSWQNHYHLTLNIHKELLECAFLVNNNKRADEIFAIILKKAKSNTDKAEMYNFKVMSCQTQGLYQEAVLAGIEGSRLVGINIKNNPNNLIIGFELLKTSYYYWKIGIKNIKKLPVLDDADKKIAMILMTSITNNGYFTDINTSFHALLKANQVSLKYGSTKSSAFAYIGYAIMLSWVFGKYKLGYDLGKIGMDLSEKFQDPMASRNNFAFGAALNHFVKHARTDRDYFRKTVEHGMLQGDTIFAAYGLSVTLENYFYEGKPLQEVKEEFARSYEYLTKTKNPTNAELYRFYKQFLAMLTEEIPFEESMFHLSYDHQKFLDTVSMPTNKYFYYIINMKFQYLLGNYETAVKWAELANPLEQSSIGQIRITTHYLYASLTYIALYEKASLKDKFRYLTKIIKMKRKFKTLAESCPENFSHMYDLIRAEHLRIKGKYDEAKTLYHSAIKSAIENDYLQNHAIINEITGKFYQQIGDLDNARIYFADARYSYLSWGCVLKVNDVDSKYNLQSSTKRAKSNVTNYNHFRSDVTYQPSVAATIHSSSNSISNSSGSNFLDLSSIMKSSQTISGEIKLEHLLEKLISIVLENAGAEKGYLLLEKEGKWFIEAQGELSKEKILVLQSIPIESAQLVPENLVKYVVRTKEAVVLHDAANETQFSSDPYLQDNQVKSAICLPIIHQKKLSGILYLENNLTTNVFTNDRIEVLNMLSSQASISIENAKLYHGLDEANRNLNRMYQVTEVLQKSTSMKTAAKEILMIICSMMGWQVGTLWWRNMESTKLQCKCCYGNVDLNFQGTDLNIEITKEKYTIERKTVKEFPLNGNKLEESGLTVMFKFPIIDDKQLVGALIFFNQESEKPDQILVNMITEIGLKILQFYERQQAQVLLEKKVQERTLELQEALETLKQTQNQLVEAEKMSSLGNLVAGVAHEINTPLGIGVTATSHLSQKTNDFMKLFNENQMKRKDLILYIQTVTEATNMIQVNLGRASELIRSFKQVAVDQSSEAKRVFNMKNYVGEILLSLKPELSKAKVEIEIDIPEDLTISSYPGAISQVLTNFIMNSIIHAFDKTKSGNVSIKVTKDLSKIKMVYKDNGKGMNQETMDQIFEPFFTTNRGGGGTGLGMHIVYNLITQRLQGTINCISSAGNGTTFEILFPLEEGR